MAGLHDKYRPKSFKQVWGNEHVVGSLKSILSRKKGIPHAFLFHGPSGCGKTTLGRIMAKKLKCSKHDLTEVDSAHYRGIDSIREIRKHMQLAPIAGKSRVWILDECHQLSKDAQNALLKALEDTPRHVYFILCTTDPHKLLKTIRNRCTSYEVESLEDTQIRDLLLNIVDKEKKRVRVEVINQIAQDCLGSARSAVVTLDKIIDLPPKQMERAARQAVMQESKGLNLCLMLLRNDKWKNVAKALRELNQEPEATRQGVLAYFNSVLLNSGITRAAYIIECFSEPFFNTGKAGLTKACFEALMEGDN